MEGAGLILRQLGQVRKEAAVTDFIKVNRSPPFNLEDCIYGRRKHRYRKRK